MFRRTAVGILTVLYFLAQILVLLYKKGKPIPNVKYIILFFV